MLLMRDVVSEFGALQLKVGAMREAVFDDLKRSSAIEECRRLHGIPRTRVMDHLLRHLCFAARADAAVYGTVYDDVIEWFGAASISEPCNILPGEQLAEWAVILASPIFIDDVWKLPIAFQDVEALGWRSVAAMPLMQDGTAVGAILIGRNAAIEWTEAEREGLAHWMAMSALINERRSVAISDAIGATAAAEQRFRSIFERAPVGVVLTNSDGQVVMVNAAFAGLVGVEASAIVGRAEREFYVTPADEATAGFLEEQLIGARGTFTLERELRPSHGEPRLVRVSTTALRGEGDERSDHLSVIQDVTEQRRAERELRDREEQLRQAQKLEAVGQLAGGLAHEFNNTLAAIAGFASLLREDTSRDDPRREDIEDILRVTQRASGVTRRLLSLSRKQLQEVATLDLRDVLDEFETLIRPVLLSTIRITTQTPPQPVLATVNRSQIEQVLMNLAINARDAMPDGGSLEFVLDTQAEDADGAPMTAACIRVSDSGAGMSAETLTRLWEPFFTTKTGYGTGLGLPTSLAIAREHRGDLRVVSMLGEGSTFSLLLPLAVAGQRTGVGTPSRGVGLPGGPTGQTILFVEDEDGVRITGQRLLERAGYTVVSATNGAEAWRLFLANIDAVDLVLTDLMMPELNGRELIKRVKSYVADMPIVVMTGYADESVEASRTPGSANATLIKPFVGDVLIGTLREVLATHRRGDRDRLALSKAGPLRRP